MFVDFIFFCFISGYYVGTSGTAVASGASIDKRSIKILTSGVNGNFPFVYSSVSGGKLILLEVNKFIEIFKLVNE